MLEKFSNPYILILLPFLIGFTLKTSKKLKKMRKSRRNLIIGIRIIILSIILLAMANPIININSKGVHTIFLVDKSASISEEETLEVENDLSKASGFLDEEDVFSYYNFSNQIKKIDNSSQVDLLGNQTDYETVLKQANLNFITNKEKRVVMFTDGNMTKGSYEDVSKIVKDNNIKMYVKGAQTSNKPDVMIKEVRIPNEVLGDAKFNVEVELFSNIGGNTDILIMQNREKIVDVSQRIEKGRNTFVLTAVASSEGINTFDVKIKPETDSIYENNEFSSFTTVIGEDKILLLGSEEKQLQEVKNIIEALGYKIKIGRGSEFSISDFINYSSIVLVNLRADDLSEQSLSSLESYVHDYGGGLLNLGGDSSYGLGGYYKTKLEKILPVDAKVKNKGEKKKLAMIVVFDKSGSMSGDGRSISKLALAKEATARVVESMNEGDELGVIAFDDTHDWVFKLSEIGQNNDELLDEIYSVGLGGGTFISGPLKTAYDSLVSVDAKSKHIILITDGQDSTGNYDEILENAKEDLITVSSIGIGSDTDRKTLEKIANLGSGRFYAAIDPADVPKIFTRETSLASKSYINTRSFVPTITSNSLLSDSISKHISKLDGYISTTAKDRADVILVSDKEEPILAAWRYGAGKTVAWTSDFGSMWSRSYAKDGNDLKIMSLLINHIDFSRTKDLVEFDVKANLSDVDVSLNDDEGYLKYKIKIIGADNKIINKGLTRTTSSTYKGKVEGLSQGINFVQIVDTNDDEAIYGIKPVMINYSKEFDISEYDTNINELLKATNAEEIIDIEEAFKNRNNDFKATKKIGEELIIIALILFLIEVFLKRFRLSNVYDFIERTSIKGIKIKKDSVEKNIEMGKINDSSLNDELSGAKEGQTKEKAQKDVEKSVIDVSRLKKKRDNNV